MASFTSMIAVGTRCLILIRQLMKTRMYQYVILMKVLGRSEPT